MEGASLEDNCELEAHLLRTIGSGMCISWELL